MINLSSHTLSAEQISVLKLGLTFCPTQRVDQFELIKDINLFSRRLMFKIIFDKSSPSSNDRSLGDPAWCDMTIADIKALEELMELWEEGGLEESDLLEADSLLTGSDPPLPHPHPPHPHPPFCHVSHLGLRNTSQNLVLSRPSRATPMCGHSLNRLLMKSLKLNGRIYLDRIYLLPN